MSCMKALKMSPECRRKRGYFTKLKKKMFVYCSFLRQPKTAWAEVSNQPTLETVLLGGSPVSITGVSHVMIALTILFDANIVFFSMFSHDIFKLWKERVVISVCMCIHLAVSLILIIVAVYQPQL